MLKGEGEMTPPARSVRVALIQQFQSVVDRMLAGQADMIAAVEKHLRKKDEEHLAKDDSYGRQCNCVVLARLVRK